VKRLPNIGLVIVLLLYIILAVTISIVTPYNKGNDEGSNLRYIEFIMVNGRLPTSYEEREFIGPKGNWPALYHLTVSGLGQLLQVDLTGPPYIKIFWDSFRYRAMDLQEEDVWYLRTEDFLWPYTGRILVLQLGRWLSIFFSSLTLILLYLTFLELWPNRYWLALLATSIWAFMPAYIFIGSVLNEDSLVAAFTTLYFWMLIRIIKYPEKWASYGVIGLVLGLSVTVKYTSIIFPLEIIFIVIIIVLQQSFSWKWGVKRLTLVGGCALLASSWWFSWVFWHLNRISELGVGAGLLSPLFTGGTDPTFFRLGYLFSGGQIGLAGIPEDTAVGNFSDWMRITFLTLWGVTIGGNFPGYPYIYLLICVSLGLAVVGLWQLWKQDQASRQWLVLMTFHVTIVLILPLINFFLSRRLGKTAQGRHIFIPALVAIACLIIWGLTTLLPQRWQRWVFPLIIVGLIGWTAVHSYRLRTFEAPPLPLRSLPAAAEWLPNPVHVQFGQVVELAGYDLAVEPEKGILQVNLAWRSLAYANESYRLKLVLLNEEGNVVSHWLGYQGSGRLPTLAWDPGDVVFDRLKLPLPLLAAGHYELLVQLVGSGGPLAIGESSDKSSLSLASFFLDQTTGFAFPHRLRLPRAAGQPAEISFALWRSEGPVEPDQRPNYRYPATISIIVADDLKGELTLVDDKSRAWPPAEAQANIYTFIIGPEWQSGDYRLQLNSGPMAGHVGQVSTGPLLTVENWWPRHFEPLPIETPLTANFANQLTLLGYKLSQTQIQAGQSFPVTLYWQALPSKSPQAHFIQFNHLLDHTGKRWGGYDRLPLEYYSTLLWAPGEIVVDGYTIPVQADAPPGEYYLNVGYYLTVGESAISLPLVVDGQRTETSSVVIGPITVIAP